MNDAPRDDSLRTRDWEPTRYADSRFVRDVPTVKWDFFASRVRPLADDVAEKVWDALFAGVGHPFRFERAAGWMGRVFRRVTSAPSDLRAGTTVKDGLREALGWADEEIVYLVFHRNDVFAAEWKVVLD